MICETFARAESDGPRATNALHPGSMSDTKATIPRKVGLALFLGIFHCMWRP
jgi:hypothetical protein